MGVFFCDKGSGLMAGASRALTLVGLGGLFLSAAVFGQVQPSKTHTGVDPQALIDLDLQTPEESEQEVVSYRLVLSDEQSKANSPSEAIDVSGGELPGRASFPQTTRPHTPLQIFLITGTPEPSTNTDGLVGDRFRTLQQAPRDAGISLAILEGNSKTSTIKLGEQPSGEVTGTIMGYENTDIEVSPAQLMFDDSNWNVKQTVTVGVKQDSGDHEVKLTLMASGGGVKDSISINVRILDILPVPVNLSADQREVEKGEKLKMTGMSLSPFTRLTSGDVLLKFEKAMSERDGENYGVVPGIPISRDAKSATVGPQIFGNTDYDNETFTVAVDGDPLASGIGFDNSSSVEMAVNYSDAKPKVCLKVSPKRLVAGDSVTVWATVTPAQKEDIDVSIKGFNPSIFDDPNIYDDFDKQIKWITIPADSTESAPFKFKTRQNDRDEYWVFLHGSTEQETGHPRCLCPTLMILRPPTIRLSAPSPNPVDEGQPVMIKATISTAQPHDVTVPLHYPNAQTTDTAEPGDYTSITSITIPANERENTGKIQTSDDADKDDEMFTVAIDENKLVAPLFAAKPKAVKVTIEDNTVPKVSFYWDKFSVPESQDAFLVKVLLDPVPLSDITLTYSTSGTATELADYKIENSGTFLAHTGKKEVFIPVEIKEDHKTESDETVTLTLKKSVWYNVGSQKTFTLTIIDNDEPEIRAPAKISVPEGGSNTVDVKLAVKPTGNVSVTFGDDGDSDLTLWDDILTFSPTNWNAAQTVMLTAAEDNDDFVDDTETLTLTAAGGGYDNVTATIAVTIEDNDKKSTVSLSISPNPVDEGKPVTVTAKLSAVLSGEVTIPLVLRVGTAESGDYGSLASITIPGGKTTGTGTITTANDADDADETFTVALGTLPSKVVPGSPSSVEVTIEDDDSAALLVTPASLTVAEGGSGNYTVQLATQPPAPVTVAITGYSGTDLTLDKTSLTFNPSSWSTAQKVKLTARQDEDFTNDTQPLILTAAGGDYDGVMARITVTITDDDHPPSTSAHVRLSASPNPVDEGESVIITATLSEALPDAVTINLRDTPGEPPTEPGDYGPLPRITIAGGARTGWGTIEIRDDDVSEGDERFTVAIGALPPEVELGSPSSVEITILGDDPPPPVEVTLSAFPNPVEEGSSVTVTAALTGVLETDVVVPLVYNDETGHPPESSDYTQVSGITIASGATEGSGQIQTSVDADGDDEAFIVALGDLPPAQLVPGREPSQFVTIQDTSAEVVVDLSATPNPVDEGNEVTVTATLSEALGTDVTIPLTLTAGTADARDYEASSPVQVEIEAGETIGDHPISIVQDAVAEDDETFMVALGILPPGLKNGGALD